MSERGVNAELVNKLNEGWPNILDAITNKQVQINTSFPAFSPTEIEEQVTFPIEKTLAGIPGLQETRSLSRNGFSQVTAIFEDSVDIYFARQQLSQRLNEARDLLPPGADPRMGATATAWAFQRLAQSNR